MTFFKTRKWKILREILLLALIAGFAFWVNRSIHIKGLYMDDLYMWSCYGEQSLREFAFPIGTSTRFRPVYWLATYLQMMLVGTHVTRFVAFNIVCNILAAWLIYYIARRLSDCPWAAAGASVCYLASRFAYYQIGQALGLMETMALVFAIAILYLLLRFMQAPPGERKVLAHGPDRRLVQKEPGCGYFWAALGIYFLLAFTHERYIVLFPLFYYVLTVRFWKADRIFGDGLKRWLSAHSVMAAAPAVVLILIILIRSFAIGKALPAGTGGTEVTETFRLQEALRYCISQVLYIFGVNDGPEHLNGLPWEQTPPEIKRLTKFSVLFIGLVCISFALLLLKELAGLLRQRRRGAVLQAGTEAMYRETGTEAACPEDRFWEHVQAGILFAGFIGLCIVCSSVTIRVEMRWIYVSYAAALLFAAYMLGEVSEGLIRDREMAVRVPVTLLFFAYIFLSVYCNIFYRGYYGNLYFWPNQLRMNSLAEETIEKYGTEGIFGKDIYILENTYQMSDFYARTFFKPYDPEKKAEGTVVHFIEDVRDVPEEEIRTGQAIVLKEIPEENAYRDITQELRSGTLQDRKSGGI